MSPRAMREICVKNGRFRVCGCPTGSSWLREQALPHRLAEGIARLPGPPTGMRCPRGSARDQRRWLSPYASRDSCSLRCHRFGVEVDAVVMVMGHSLAEHSSRYRWDSNAATAAVFQAVISS